MGISKGFKSAREFRKQGLNSPAVGKEKEDSRILLKGFDSLR